jgi:adenine-specific DNA-methyltransferase
MTNLTNILSKLTALIEKNKAYIVDGSLNRNLLAADARKYDPELLNLLQKDKEIKDHFFTATDSGLVFKKDVFLQFIMNKEFLPDSYTKYKIKIGLGVEDGSLLSESGDVVLNWPYKDAILEGGQDKEDQKRSELFFNEVLAPDQITRLLDDKVFTNWKRYDSDGEHELDTLNDNDNLIVKGNNLVVLHSLKKRYAGKVKLIYIDPPYYFSGKKNEDSFAYNSNFKFSTWLTFMKNRLEIARQMLSEDGVMVIQLNYEAIGHLKVMMDEIFGRDNLLNMISVSTKSPSGFQTVNRGVFGANEYILAYGKSSSSTLNKLYVQDGYDDAYSNYLVNPDDPYEEWQFESIKLASVKSKGFESVESFKKEFDENILDKLVEEFAFDNAHKVFQLESIGNKAGKETVKARDLTRTDRGKVVEVVTGTGAKRYVYNGRQIAFYKEKIRRIDGKDVPSRLLTDSWNDISWMGIGTEGGVSLKGGKKPERLIQRILELGSTEGDLIMDYHVGSGTTAAVAHKMKRQYIGIEQLQYEENDPTVRLINVINGDQTGVSKKVDWQSGGSFVYTNILNNSNKFRKRVEAAKNEADYLKLLKEATSSSFLSYRIDPKKLDEKEFRKLSAAEKHRLLIELIDNNTLYVNYEDINDPIFKVNDKDKEFNKKLYETETQGRS